MKNIISRILFRRNYDDLPLASEIYIDLKLRNVMLFSLIVLSVVLTAFIVSLIF